MKVQNQGFLAALILATAVTSTADDLVVSGDRLSRTYDCKGEDAVLNGSHNTVTFRNCDTVVVNGTRNTVAVADAETITVTGSHNALNWSGRKPTIVNTGSKNEVRGVAGDDRQPATVDVDTSGVSFGDVSIGGDGIRIRENPEVAGGPFVLAKDAETVTHDCKGGDAEVRGDRNTVRLVDCRAVKIEGDRNTVRADKVQSLKVMGDENTVSWSASKEPEIANLGDQNTIRKK